MSDLRVLIVDDSSSERAYLGRVLARTPGMHVVGEARDGRSAIECCKALRPDVMTLDMILPDTGGVEVTEQIMAECPTPILIVSSAANRSDVVDTLDALAAGAVDVLEKPDGSPRDRAWDAKLVAAVRLVARVVVMMHPRFRLRGASRAKVEAPSSEPPSDTTGRPARRVVAIGASTGGPSAVAAILRALPEAFPLPILVVVHMASSFGETFVEWLDTQSSLPVVPALDGAPLPPLGAPAKVLVALPDRHLSIREGRLRLTRTPEIHGCRPAVDVLFESLAQEMGGAAIACILTGMGRDGAAGLLAMRAAKALTIAQDESTSVVFGMPREAIRLKAAEWVLPLYDVAPFLVRATRSASPSRTSGEDA